MEELKEVWISKQDIKNLNGHGALYSYTSPPFNEASKADEIRFVPASSMQSIPKHIVNILSDITEHGVLAKESNEWIELADWLDSLKEPA